MNLVHSMYSLCPSRHLLLLVIACFVVSHAPAQDTTFRQVYLKVATELTHTDPPRALHISDSLFRNTTDQKEKLSALMLTANVYYRTNDLKSALKYAQQAKAIAITIKDYDWQIRIHGFYSSIYRDVRFIDEGLKHLEQVDKLLPKLEDKRKRAVVDILNLQAKAYFHYLNSEFDEVLDVIERGVALYPYLEESSVGPYHIANSEELRARGLSL